MARRKTGPSKNLKRKKSATALRRINASRGTGVSVIGSDIASLRDGFTQLTRDIEGLAGDTSGAALEQLRGRLDSFASSVDGMVGDVRQRGRQAIGAVDDLRGDLVGAVEGAVRARPLTTIALAIGIGFALSSSMRR